MQGVDFYADNADSLLLDQFILEHKLLVKKIALHIKKRLPSFIELEELLQAGFVGLLEARQHYAINGGASFETFASIRIRGAIIDFLRKNTWNSREVMRNMRVVNAAIARVEQREQRAATSEEIANELGIDIDAYMEICQQISVCNVINIENMDEEETIAADESEDPAHIVEKEALLAQLKALITALPEREQLLLSLYYIDELTFKEIAQVLDLTEARICQLHSQAIAKLQSRLAHQASDSFSEA